MNTSRPLRHTANKHVWSRGKLRVTNKSDVWIVLEIANFTKLTPSWSGRGWNLLDLWQSAYGSNEKTSLITISASPQFRLRCATRRATPPMNIDGNLMKPHFNYWQVFNGSFQRLFAHLEDVAQFDPSEDNAFSLEKMKQKTSFIIFRILIHIQTK